ncbi:MAG TPA: SRPBCC domain-containing protein [Flavobacteriales bacterium]|nr:SRPBCC domain-containing protein [Flavobacteriales bacterium]
MTTLNDTSDREIVISRLLNAPRELVFDVWTKTEHLVHWYGPDGFTISNKEHSVKVGGKWRFTMHGPNGMDFPNRIVYTEVIHPEKLVYEHCDDENPEKVSFSVVITFETQGNKTKLTMRSVFPTKADYERVVKEYGAVEGVKQTVGKLEQYLETYYNNLKTKPMSKVSTYLNFSRNTEEAFNFYKSVFGGEFVGGIARLGDTPMPEGAPQLAHADKHLIMHIALPILGGHMLMGTDAPESMGFKLNFGNNMYVNLEPDTRAETKRLFDALSNGGEISMPLTDMFWGSYFGTCTDKFGVQWMFNCGEK